MARDRLAGKDQGVEPARTRMMLAMVITQFWFSVVLMAVLLGIILTGVAYCILLERKVSAWMQDRIGPNRAGPRGLLQPLADGVKFFIKEDIVRSNVDRAMFVLAPAIAFTVAGVAFAVIPWAGAIEIGGRLLQTQVATLDIGLLYILAVGSLAVYGVVFGGWASNNKYSFYGAIRGAASMLSYEVPLGLALLTIVLTSGQVRLENIVAQQMGTPDHAGSTWNILLHPLVFIIMLTTAFAETNRSPFDLAEAEQELIGGYQTEYSSMKMALFYLGEYFHMITASAFMAVLFLGGWELFPFSERTGWAWVHWLNFSPTWPAMLGRFGVIFAKIFCFIFFYMWVRWTLPRFRFDQLMTLCWRWLVPVGMILVTWAGVLVYIGKPVSIWATAGDVALFVAITVYVAVQQPTITGRQYDLPKV